MCPETGELWRDGAAVRIHDKPFQLLLAFLEHPGEILSRQDLQQRLWPDHTFVDFDNGLNNAIGRLRCAFCEKAQTPHFVETVYRRGYRFIALTEVSASPSNSTKRWVIVAASARLVRHVVASAPDSANQRGLTTSLPPR